MKSTSWGSVGRCGSSVSMRCTSRPGSSSGGMRKKSSTSMPGTLSPAGRDQHEPPQPVLLLDGEAGREQTADREADEVDVAGEAELVEQLDVVEHEVVHLAEPVEVARLAEARVVGDQHAVLRRSTVRRRPSRGRCPPPWKNTSGGAGGIARREHHRRRAVDVEGQPLPGERGDRSVAARAGTARAGTARDRSAAPLMPAPPCGPLAAAGGPPRRTAWCSSRPSSGACRPASG